VLAELAQIEERLPEETIEVRFSPEVTGDETHRPGS
jgi:hypothetical protein